MGQGKGKGVLTKDGFNLFRLALLDQGIEDYDMLALRKHE
jgi:hypothetical protein